MKREKVSSAAASGIVALVFLLLGFQAAIFTGRLIGVGKKTSIEAMPESSESALSSDEEQPENQPAEQSNKPKSAVEKAIASVVDAPLEYGDARVMLSEKFKKPELFSFDPNLVTSEELQRLGFSPKQADVIIKYRDKGGRFASKADFAKMYVVDSTTYQRLAPYISIAKLDLNSADSAALVQLKGIGPYYAAKILEYRERLGGYFSEKEQLLEIEGIDGARFSGFAEGIEVKPLPWRFNIWEATLKELERHPYIGTYAAKGIMRYRSVVDTASWRLQDLIDSGLIEPEKVGYFEKSF